MTERRGLIQTVNFPRTTGSFREFLAAIAAGNAPAIFIDATTVALSLQTTPGASDAVAIQSVTDGHLIFLTITSNFETADTMFPAAAEGFTAVPALTQSGDDVGTNRHQQVWWKFADSQGATVDIENSTSTAHLTMVNFAVFSGVHADVFDVTPVSGHLVSAIDDNTPTTPAITTVTDQSLVISQVMHTGTAHTLAVAPTNYTVREDFLNGALSHAIGVRVLSTAGVETPGAWSAFGISTVDILGYTIALKSAGLAYIPFIEFMGSIGDGEPGFLAPEATDDYELPPNIVGDLMLYVGISHSVTDPPIDVTTAGWIRVAALSIQSSSGSARNQEVWYKFSTGGEPTITVQNKDGSNKWMSGIVSVWRGVQAAGDGGPFDVTPVAGHTVDDETGEDVQTPAITTVTDSIVFVSSFCAGEDHTSEVVPAGYTLRETHVSGGSFISQALATKLIATAGLETPGVWALEPAGLDVVGFSLALVPAQDAP